MKAFYHPDQALHDPKQFMRVGVLADPTDLPERTSRLLGALAARSITVEAPADLGRAPAELVHTPDYLNFLETIYDRWRDLPNAGPEVLPNCSPYWNGAPDQDARPPCRSDSVIGQVGWYMGDLAVPIGPETYRSAIASSQTAAAAAQAVVDGADAAYALCRPSGHHARRDRATGFCYINNAAVAAETLRKHFGRVAVLDVDAHHGDGTQEIFYRRADVQTVSVHVDPLAYYPYYIGYADETGASDGLGHNLNLPLKPGSGDAEMLAAVDQGLARIADFGAQAVVLSLGYDAHRADPLSMLQVTEAAFAGIGAKLREAGLPLVIVQEGGYAIDVIAGCLEEFLAGLAGERG
ncbi:histone deacetylase family protein [Paracoccus sp. 11-3]|uniref:Histone deacetylase family protein n=1 Tax=Paracoccus amoyensis TaxID=2760093 RepID=A0A926GLW8_9RHOB|nr:histone deacetylase family protein [Paracoccus amoyensis]MBC9246335.1 histone deacetylase family protein [Paracoccus amoyensis]